MPKPFGDWSAELTDALRRRHSENMALDPLRYADPVKDDETTAPAGHGESPVSALQWFVDDTLRAMAAAVGVTYEQLAEPAQVDEPAQVAEPPQHELAAIVELMPEVLAQLLQLPPGAYIDAVDAPIEREGLVRMRIRGAGWRVRDGERIPMASCTVTTALHADTQTRSHAMHWSWQAAQDPTENTGS